MTSRDDPDSRYFSPPEVARALARLSRADVVRLTYLARIWARRIGPGLEDDLLNEAIARALDGRRRWNSSYDLSTFMSQTMRSLSDEWQKKKAREIPVPAESLELQAAPVPAVQEVEMAIQQVRDEVTADCGDDPVALALFEARLADEDPRDTRERLGLDPTQYDTAHRRLQRRLAQLFPEGLPL